MFLRQASSLPSLQKENHSIQRDPERKSVYPKIRIRSHPRKGSSKGASEHRGAMLQTCDQGVPKIPDCVSRVPKSGPQIESCLVPSPKGCQYQGSMRTKLMC